MTETQALSPPPLQAWKQGKYRNLRVCALRMVEASCLLIVHLEDWSGKAHYNLHEIRIDLTFLYAKGESSTHVFQ